MDEKNTFEIQEWKPDIIHIHTTGINLNNINILKELCPYAIFLEKNVFQNLLHGKIY